MRIVNAFQSGGWGMWPVLVSGLALLGVAAAHAISPARRRLYVVVGVGTTTLLAGVLGFVTGAIATLSHAGREQERAMEMAMVGIGESLHNLGFALFFAFLAAIMTTVGVSRARQTLEPSRSPERA